MKDDSKHGKVFLASLSVALCFLLVFPLVSPGLQAYAEELQNAPPKVTLLAAPAAASPGPAQAGADGAAAAPGDSGQPTVGSLMNPAASLPAAAPLPTPSNVAAPQKAPPKEAARRAPDTHVPPRPIDGLRAGASANMAKGKSPAEAKGYTINDDHTATFTEPDGSYTTAFSEERIAYKDESGKLKPIDNTLKAVNPLLAPAYYANTDADYTAAFPDTMDQSHGVSFAKDGSRVEMIPIGGDFSRSLAEGNAIRYTDVYPGVDFEYTLVSDTIKENIILNQYTDAPSFDFELKTGGMKAALVNGDVCVYKDGQTDPFYILSSPEMQDASGAASSAIVQSLREENGKTIITVTPDAAWLSDLNRAYPVKIDPTLSLNDARVYMEMVANISPDSVDSNAQTYGGSLCGYDDGYATNSLPWPFGQTRIYAKLLYDFSHIPTEAAINSATFSLYQKSNYSHGSTFFTLNEVEQNWNQTAITWHNQPTGQTYLDGKNANTSPGYITWNVRSAVNDWVQGLKPNYGLMLMTSPEGQNVQAEDFTVVSWLPGGNMPTLTVNWSIPDPVPDTTGINDLTINLRPITEKAVTGKQQFDGVFADGISKPETTVDYSLMPDNSGNSTYAGYQLCYPDSTNWTSTGGIFPNGTKYKDKLSNWQSVLYNGLSYNKEYQVQGTATYDDGVNPAQTSSLKKSDQFLVYKVSQQDTLPSIANHYGIPLTTLMADNHVQDSLIIDGNTLFIRNPKTAAAYNPPPLTDDQKRAIDAALMGRGLHCEYGYEPVNLATGNFMMEQTDAAIPEIEGAFTVFRTYNSMGEAYQSVFGRHWSTPYAQSLSTQEDGTILYITGDGRTLSFTPDGAGGYISPAGYFYTLTQVPYPVGEDTYYKYELKGPDGSATKFNAFGMVTDLVSAGGLDTVIGYDANYHIQTVTSPTGKVYTFTEDTYGRVSTITQPDGGVMKYAYDTNDNLISYTDASGDTVRYVYDSGSHMTECYDGNNNRSVANTYDSLGRVLTQTDAEGGVTTFSYTDNASPSDNTVTITDADGNVTVYTVDDQKRIINTSYADGQTTDRAYSTENTQTQNGDLTYEYDSLGNITKETRLDGRSQEYEYGDSGFPTLPTKITDYDGAVTQMEYSTTGDLIKMTRPDGKSTETSYDGYHRPITVTAIDGTVTSYSYDDGSGNEGAVVTSMTDAAGNVYNFGYDAMNRRVSEEDPLGDISRTSYDHVGRVLSETNADGGVTTYTLDNAGNATGLVDANGNTATATHDKASRVTSVTDPMGGKISYTYDAMGNKLTETNQSGAVTTYSYDAGGRLSKTEGPLGAFTQYTYDSKGRLSSQVNERGASVTAVYDDSLNLPLTVTDQNGAVISYTYDAVGRLLTTTYPDGTKESYTYLPAGQVETYTDKQGITTTYAYTGRDFVGSTTETGAGGAGAPRTTSKEYDALGNMTKSTDALGNSTDYTYDALSRVTSQTNPLGAVTSFSYDPMGRLTGQTDPNGGVSKLTYDLLGNLLSVTDAKGNVTSYAYDKLSRVTKNKDAAGDITAYAYSPASRLLSVTNALGAVQSYTYDIAGNPITVTDENGNTQDLAYDSSSNITKVTLANGEIQTMGYDALSRQNLTIDPMGTRTDTTYDSMGNIETEKNTLGDATAYSYDAFGRLAKTTDQLGRTDENTYDAFGEVIQTKTVNGDVTKTDYDALGRSVKTTYADGSYTSTVYDAAGNTTSERAKNGGVTGYTYDPMGKVLTQTDPLGGEISNEYDVLGNLTDSTDANGNKTSYGYDALARLTSQTDPLGGVTAYEYDAMSHLLKQTSPEGGAQQYRYDPVGNLLQSMDPAGDITGYAYDQINRLTTETSPRGGETSYTYDALSHLTSMTDPLGAKTLYSVLPDGQVGTLQSPSGGAYSYTYDGAHRISSVTSPLGLTRSFTYDDQGNLKSETDNLGRTSTYSYDVMHNLTGAVNPTGIKTSLSYDNSGNLTSVLDADGAKTTYSYDLLSRLTGVKDAVGGTVSLNYDPVGNLTKMTQPNGGAWNFGYDANGNAVKAKDPLGNVSLSSYDKNGQDVLDTNALGQTTSYTYDPAGRLTGQTDAAGAATAFSYDADGNLSQVTDKSLGKTNYTYDLADNLTSVTDPANSTTKYSYDPSGNLKSVTDAEGRVTSYGYDSVGDVTSITDPAGNVKSFAYDIAGRLKQAASPSGGTTTYNYDKLNELVDKTYSEDSSQNVMYMYGPTGNRISMNDGSGNSKYTYDLLGRITKMTDGDGKTVSYAYGANGQVSFITYPDGTKVSYGYDLNGDLTTVKDSSGTSRYFYDALSRPVLLVRSDGTRTSYAYDQTGNLSALKNTAADGTLISSFSYTFDAQGRTKTETETDGAASVVTLGTSANSGVTTRAFIYNPSGELTAMTEKSPGGTVNYTYTYDRTGNRTKMVKAGAGQDETVVYLYNKAGQMASETSSLSGRTDYTYDKDGNMVSKKGAVQETTYTYTVEDRLQAVHSGGRLLMAASYDGDGNRVLEINLRPKNMSAGGGDEDTINTSAKKAVDETPSGMNAPDTTLPPGTVPKEATGGNGNSGGIRNIFLFGFLHYLQALFMPVTTADDAANSQPAIDKFWYREVASAGLSEQDIQSVQNMKLPPNEESAILSARIPDVYTGYRTQDTYELTNYVNDVNQQNPEVLAEYAGSSALKADYTYGNGRLSTSNAAAEGVVGQTVPASYISNGQNSVQTLLSNAGTALASYSYGPFGETETANVGAGGDSGVQASFYGYNGENFDSLTNLQYLRARYYDPTSGRFTAADTNPGMLFNPLTQNLYSYAGNNPVNYSDPSGHAWYNDLWNTVVNGAKAAATAVVNLAKSALNLAKSAVNTAVNIAKSVGNTISSIFSPPSAPSANSGGGNSVPGRPGTTWTPVSPPGLPAILGLPAAVLVTSTIYMAQYLQAGGTVSRDTAQQYTSRLVSMANQKSCETTTQRIARAALDNPVAVWLTQHPGPLTGLFDAAGFVKTTDTNGNNIYVIRQDALQQYGGYNALYDKIFGAATSMDKAIFDFTVGDINYRFWVWKGNYLNLGAGAEFGIYKQLGNTGQYIVDQSLAMPIKMKLVYQGKSIIDYVNGTVWWAAAFNSFVQGVTADKLTASFTVTFNTGTMYDVFYTKYGQGLDKDSRWNFMGAHVATFTF